MCIFKKARFEMYPETCRLSGGYNLLGDDQTETLKSQQWANKAEKEKRNVELNRLNKRVAQLEEQVSEALKKVAE